MRVSKPPQERRAELISAARALFDRKGVEKTRISDIVREVGVAQGVFYYYFSSKEEMVRVVALQVAGEVTARSEAILADRESGFHQKLVMMIELVIDLVDQFTSDDATSLQQPLGLGRDYGTPGMEGYRLMRENLHRLVRQGVQSGVVKVEYPDQAVDVLIYGLHRLAMEKLPGRAVVFALVEQALGLEKGSLVGEDAVSAPAVPGNESV